ncbi:MAG: hypothetical protein A2511_01880 [Deltaproteobacteria bacterium RIFOXYD12_FULL_50_9]|nr:MAG: hypothetical protein A2511_01880 [Deltaproteobacteria bacterium RIFOXYD12_FULL_50_9]
MTFPHRVSAGDIWKKVLSGQAILVCAHEGQKEFRGNHLESAMDLAEFRARLPTMALDQEIIFYCSCSKESVSAGVAENYLREGFTNIHVLKGGAAAWKKAGYPVVSE